MIKFDLLLKRMWTVLAVLFCTVVSAQAAAITYQLTTHVDGRTITASKSVSAGASLIDNMPQQLWRASTTYKFYADADLTEEITEAPAEDATVYVDYEFNPPFAVAENTTDGPYYTLRGFYANGNPYYFYADGNKVDAIVGSIEGLRNQDQAKWAYIGDGFSLNLYNKATGTWLAFGQSDPTMQANPLEKGWQLYSNNYVNPHYPEVSAYFMLAVPSADESLKNNTQIFGVSNMSGKTTLDHPGGSGSVALDNKGHWNEQGVWQHGQDKISWASLFGTLQEGVLTIWHVEYRIFDGDNNLLDQKFYDKENEAKPVDFYYDAADPAYAEYAYYHDAEFTQIWDPNDANDLIPATGTTIVYVKKINWKVEYLIYDGDNNLLDQKIYNKVNQDTPVNYYYDAADPAYAEYAYYHDAEFTQVWDPADANDLIPAIGATIVYVKKINWKVEYLIYDGDNNLLDQKIYNKVNQDTPVNYYYDAADPNYDEYAYYHDADFTQIWDPTDANDLIPATGTTIVYVKKIKHLFQRTFTVGKWMTLVLPDYNLLPQNGITGRFLDYVAVESKENATDGYHWDCHLKFREVEFNQLIPNRPYLYLPTEIEGTDDNVRSKVIQFPLEGTPSIVSHKDDAQPDVTISMYGTYEDKELVPCEPVEPKGYKNIFFYFGNPSEDVYNFYTVENPVTITPTVCYFDIMATKNYDTTIGGFGAKFSFFDGTNAINNIEGVKKSNDKVYNLNGQQVQGNLQKGIYIVNGKKVLVK